MEFHPPLLLRLLMRDAARQAVPLSLHGLALAVSAFLVVMLATIVGYMVRQDAPGAPCSADVRLLELRSPTGELQVAPAVLAASFDAGSSLRTHVLGSQRLPAAPGEAGSPVVVRVTDALLAAVCLDERLAAGGEASVPGPHGFGGESVVLAPGLKHFIAIRGFRGLAGIGEGATWVRERDLPWLRVGPDDWNEVLLVQRLPGRTWEDIEREVESFVAARPAMFAPGTQPDWIYASGVNREALARGLRGVVLLGLVAGGILALVIANLSVYFVGRHPRFAGTATVLSVLGLSRPRLGGLAAFEPALLAALALPLGAWAASRYLAAQPGFRHVEVDFWPMAVAGALLGVGVAVVAWRRVAATRASLRPGVAGFRRLSGRLASLLVFVQLAAAVPLVALSVQAGLGWHQARTAQPRLPPEDLWMARWQADANRAPPELHGAMAAVERDDPGIALAANLLPLPGGRISAGERELLVAGRRITVAHNQAGPRFLVLALGVAPDRAEAWLGERASGTPRVIVGRSLAGRLSPLPPRLLLASPGLPEGTETSHDVVGELPDLATMWAGRSQPPGVVLTAWDESVAPTSGVMLARAGAVPLERFQRAAGQLGAALGEVSRVAAIADRAMQGERQMADAFGLMALVGVACMLVGLVSVLRGVEVARALEFSVLFALGASKAEVASLHLAKLARPAMAGALVGLGFAWLATWVVAGRRPLLAPLATPSCLVALAAIALLAWVCAQASAVRVSRRDPMPALRSE